MPDAGPRLSDFDYRLPPERIAQGPARPRDASRLLVLDRAIGGVSHRRFRDLPDLLAPGDLVVLNDTRVLRAAFSARRGSGGRVGGCFLRDLGGGLWEVLLAGRGRLRQGETLDLLTDDGRPAGRLALVGRAEGGVWHVRPPDGAEAMDLLRRIGRPPLPPYIRRSGAADPRRRTDPADYQTVYARRSGAVAAPTAGLHFTPQVLNRLAARGIERAFITLHVGLGTFQPIRSARLGEHRMEAEYFAIGGEAAGRIEAARAAGRRIVAVGTTTVRALESWAAGDFGPASRAAAGRPPGRPPTEAPAWPRGEPLPPASPRGEAPPPAAPASGWTRLFIYPPFAFRLVGALLTNFHLPRTTLLALVCALAGRERVLAAYGEAVREGYRFYSYGDAMLIV